MAPGPGHDATAILRALLPRLLSISECESGGDIKEAQWAIDAVLAPLRSTCVGGKSVSVPDGCGEVRFLEVLVAEDEAVEVGSLLAVVETFSL